MSQDSHYNTPQSLLDHSLHLTVHFILSDIERHMPEKARVAKDLAFRAKQLADLIINNPTTYQMRLEDVRRLLREAEEAVNEAFTENLYVTLVAFGAATLTMAAKPLHLSLMHTGFRDPVTIETLPTDDVDYQDAYTLFTFAQHALAAAEFLITQLQRHHHNQQIMNLVHDTTHQLTQGNYQATQQFNLEVAALTSFASASAPPSLSPLPEPHPDDLENFVIILAQDYKEEHEA